jgi:hypothetical protein
VASRRTRISLDGRPLTEAQAAPHRASVRARAKAQLLHALAACIQARWAGGYVGLRRAAAAALGGSAGGPTCALWMEPLAQRIISRRTGGAPCVTLVQSFSWQGETLEVLQCFADAARVYKACVDAVAPHAAPHAAAASMLPMMWS